MKTKKNEIKKEEVMLNRFERQLNVDVAIDGKKIDQEESAEDDNRFGSSEEWRRRNNR